MSNSKNVVQSLKKGDFILADMIGRVKETNNIFDITLEDVAKKENLFSEEAIYRPRLIIIGEGWVVNGLDEALEGLTLGETKTIEVTPEKGFGERDPSAIKVLSIREFRRQSVKPHPGMRVQIGARRGTVVSVGGGRVRVDFNPPLAGKTLIYEVTVQKKITAAIDKIKALIERRISDVPVENFKVSVRSKKVTIDVPKDAMFLEGIQFVKRGIAKDIRKFLTNIESIAYVEAFTKEDLLS
ncbi:MAG: FKBP-type peptidyl-prolyl cis-trans isomerase [Candidatus Hodarchaeota archaeon]